MNTALIIPAAGSGSRLGVGIPKALVDVAGMPLVRRAVERFANATGLTEIVIAAHPSSISQTAAATADVTWPGVAVRIVEGGDTRQASVFRALRAVTTGSDLVCIHDAARPFVSPATIDAVIATAAQSGGATAASRPRDSIRVEHAPGATRAVDRSSIWLVETPQAFRFDLLYNAHHRAAAEGITATDDAALVERFGSCRVAVVESIGPNFKVTDAEDLRIACWMIER